MTFCLSFHYFQITISSTWTFEDFKVAILEGIGTPSIHDVNLQVLIRVLPKPKKGGGFSLFLVSLFPYLDD